MKYLPGGLTSKDRYLTALVGTFDAQLCHFTGVTPRTVVFQPKLVNSEKGTDVFSRTMSRRFRLSMGKLLVVQKRHQNTQNVEQSFPQKDKNVSQSLRNV